MEHDNGCQRRLHTPERGLISRRRKCHESPVSLTVNNSAPSTTVVQPPSGATLDSANEDVFDAVASPGVTQVSFDITGECGGIVLTATPTIVGWVAVTPASSGGDPPGSLELLCPKHCLLLGRS